MEKKYRLVPITDEEWCLTSGARLHRIEALKDFADVKKGDLGGYVEGEKNLSQEGNCWIYDNAKVYDYARVSDNAKVLDEADVYDDAIVCGSATIEEQAQIYGNAKVRELATVGGNVQVRGFAQITGSAHVTGQNMVITKNTVLKDGYIEGRDMTIYSSIFD
jgi:UDP-3-O-[3-hydroxymyristoyl] glucosamine N-acyltransferase